MEYIKKIGCRFPDFDSQGWANNGAIAAYYEDTYLGFIMDCVDSNWHFGHLPIVITDERQKKYKKPIPPCRWVMARLIVTEIRHASFTVYIDITDESMSTIYSWSYKTLTHIDMTSVKPKRLGSEALENLKKYMVT